MSSRNSHWQKFVGWLSLQPAQDVLDLSQGSPKLHPNCLLDFACEELVEHERGADVISAVKSRIEDLYLIADTPLTLRNLERVQERTGYLFRGNGSSCQAIPAHVGNVDVRKQASTRLALQIEIWATVGARVSEIKSCILPAALPEQLTEPFVKCIPDSQKTGLSNFYVPRDLALRALRYKARYGVSILPLKYNDVAAILEMSPTLRTHSFRVGFATAIRVIAHKLGFGDEADLTQTQPCVLARTKHLLGWAEESPQFFKYSKHYMCYLEHDFLVHDDIVSFIFEGIPNVPLGRLPQPEVKPKLELPCATHSLMSGFFDRRNFK